MEEKMNCMKFPQTDSIQELAHFWDTNDLTDFEDELEEVTEPIFERETIIAVHLEPEETKIVKSLAKLRGISYSNLIQEWVVERIHAVD